MSADNHFADHDTIMDRLGIFSREDTEARWKARDDRLRQFVSDWADDLRRDDDLRDCPDELLALADQAARVAYEAGREFLRAKLTEAKWDYRLRGFRE